MNNVTSEKTLASRFFQQFSKKNLFIPRNISRTSKKNLKMQYSTQTRQWKTVQIYTHQKGKHYQ